MGVNKKLNHEDIRQFVTDDLVLKIKTDKAAMDKLKFGHAVSSLDNPASIRVKRRDIARLKTELVRRNKESKAK
jgi:large subunit ribosomal protein L29